MGSKSFQGMMRSFVLIIFDDPVKQSSEFMNILEGMFEEIAIFDDFVLRCDDGV
jgi:hypothetical protein